MHFLSELCNTLCVWHRALQLQDSELLQMSSSIHQLSADYLFQLCSVMYLYKLRYIKVTEWLVALGLAGAGCHCNLLPDVQLCGS